MNISDSVQMTNGGTGLKHILPDATSPPHRVRQPYVIINVTVLLEIIMDVNSQNDKKMHRPSGSLYINVTYVFIASFQSRSQIYNAFSLVSLATDS